MKINHVLATAGLTIIAVAATGAALANTKAEIDERVGATLNQFESLNPSNKSLQAKSAGMLVFPSVTKGGAGVAAEHGTGVLQVGGKTVDYYSVSGGSVGLTLGVAQHSGIIMFMTKDALNKFLATEGWSVGADAGITMVSAGANGKYDSKIENKPILAFQFSEKGLLGDLSIEGEKITKIATPK
jgi:lipid-binding SYLF domain-containing protein